MSRILLYRIRPVKYKYYIITIDQMVGLLQDYSNKHISNAEVFRKLIEFGRLDLYERFTMFYERQLHHNRCWIGVYMSYTKWPAGYVNTLENISYVMREILEKTIEYGMLDNFYYLSGRFNRLMFIGYSSVHFNKISLSRAMLVRNISFRQNNTVEKIEYVLDLMIKDVACILYRESHDINLTIKKTKKLINYLGGPVNIDSYNNVFTHLFIEQLQNSKKLILY